ncbi:MAG: PilZ domain-containing protein [Blastocatellia bacterium]
MGYSRPAFTHPPEWSPHSRLVNELEHFLARVECAVDPYEVLGICPTANYEEILRAYQQATETLFPNYLISASFSREILTRIERNFARISRAFTVLASAGRRQQYDGGLVADPVVPVRVPLVSRKQMQEAARRNETRMEEEKETRADDAKDIHEKYPRRFPRFRMRLPVDISGYDQPGFAWRETAETGYVSRGGVMIRMRNRIRHGTVVQLALPFPLKLRAYDFEQDEYKSYGIVRSVQPRGDGVRDVGVELLGQEPPDGYSQHPWEVFRLPSWHGVERRRMPRFQIARSVRLDFYSDTRRLIAQGTGQTETLSRGGACIRPGQVPDVFDLVGISSQEDSFESMAVVADRFPGNDGVERLCLQFINHEWPV